MALTKVTAGLITANAVIDSFGTQSITGDKLGLQSVGANNINTITVVSSGIGIAGNNTTKINPYKILGQVQVGGSTYGNTMTNVYVVPASTQTVVSTIAICNQSNAAVSLDVASRISTQALGNQHYIIKSFALPAAETLILEPRLSMNATSILSANITGANANTSNVTISAFGVETL